MFFIEKLYTFSIELHPNGIATFPMQSQFMDEVRPLSKHSLKIVPLGTSPGPEHEHGAVKRVPVASS